MPTPIPEDIALRIGLAARALPDTAAGAADPGPRRCDRSAAHGREAGAGSRSRTSRTRPDGELADIDPDALKTALAMLKGEGIAESDPPPPLDPYAEGDMPGSIRVACASNDGEALDGHFGSARRFLIYQVSAEEVRLIDARAADDLGAEDKNAHRAELIRDCQVLYVASIGGPAAAKVVKADIHPIKDAAGGSARDRMTTLQGILADKPPPWLAKVMGQAPEERIRFERDGRGERGHP